LLYLTTDGYTHHKCILLFFRLSPSTHLEYLLGIGHPHRIGKQFHFVRPNDETERDR
jgi:hypothetical protein